MVTTGLNQMENAKRELRVPSTFLHQLNKQMQTPKRHSSSTTPISKIEKSNGKKKKSTNYVEVDKDAGEKTSTEVSKGYFESKFGNSVFKAP